MSTSTTNDLGRLTTYTEDTHRGWHASTIFWTIPGGPGAAGLPFLRWDAEALMWVDETGDDYPTIHDAHRAWSDQLRTLAETEATV
jgi:hypothetical protein